MLRAIERSRAWLFSLALFSLVPVPLCAQTALDVTGTVSATDGTPVAGARVTLAATGTAATAVTGARGAFTLHLSAGGTYAVTVEAPGFAPISRRTVTLDRENATLSLVLSKATTSALTTIEQVRASAGETVSTSSAPVVNLGAQAAASQGVTEVSDMIWNQLATTPVIPLGGGSNATVTFALRGPDPTETLVDIDGHQVNNGNTGDFDLSLIDPAALQTVQLVYGISPSSLVGPNTLGGAINILTLEPTATDRFFVRGYGGSFGSFGETIQGTGSDARWGYAFSLHRATSSGEVNQSVLAPPDAAPAPVPPHFLQTIQNVGSGYAGDSGLAKLRYQLGGPNGYGYLQLSYRGSSVGKDESALLTNYTPPGSDGNGGDDAVHANGEAVRADGIPPFDGAESGYQSFAGTELLAHQGNYGFDAQLPLGNAAQNGAPATLLQFSHLTTLSDQSVTGPGQDTLPYLYNQSDLLGDDWLRIDQHFSRGTLSLKYDLGTESLTTDFVQGQVMAESVFASPPPLLPQAAAPAFGAAKSRVPENSVQQLSQVQRSTVLRYDGDPTSQIHFSLAGYFSNFSTFGTSFDPRAGFVWTPTGSTSVRASVGTTFQTPQLSELVVPPPAERIAVGGIVYIGNPDLQPDRATEYDIGAEQIFGRLGHQLHLSADVYRTNLRSPSSQLNVEPGGPRCGQTGHPPCPVSYPVNAGNGVYSGVQLHAEQQLGPSFRLRAGWDVDSSYLTVIPANIQDGTLVAGEQSLGQPLHKAYVGFERGAERGIVYGAELNYEGTYNELNLGPYATLSAHAVYRGPGFDFGLYGTNLTNAYDNPFTVNGGGILYGAEPGNPMISTPAYVLQGRKVIFVVTKSIP